MTITTNASLSPVKAESVTALKGLKGGTYGCPSKSKPVNYRFDQYLKDFKIQVQAVTTSQEEGKTAEIKVELPEGYEVRQRVGNNAAGIDRANSLERKEINDDSYWTNIFWVKAQSGQIFVKPEDRLDIVRVDESAETPVATIEIIDVHPEGEIISAGRVADEDYIFADVRHAPLYNPNNKK